MPLHDPGRRAWRGENMGLKPPGPDRCFGADLVPLAPRQRGEDARRAGEGSSIVGRGSPDPARVPDRRSPLMRICSNEVNS